MKRWKILNRCNFLIKKYFTKKTYCVMIVIFLANIIIFKIGNRVIYKGWDFFFLTRGNHKFFKLNIVKKSEYWRPASL